MGRITMETAPHPDPASHPRPRRARPPNVTLRGCSWGSVPLLCVLITWLAAARPAATYGSPLLLMALSFFLFTLASSVIAWVVGRNFLRSGAPGLLVLGAGVVAFGATSVVAAAAGVHDPNLTVTIHNLGVLVAGACHLAAALLSLRPRAPLGRPVAALACAYAGALVAIAAVALLAGRGTFPVFFVQVRGGTPLRQLVLASAIGSFAAAAALLCSGGLATRSAFRHWYALGLSLVAVGLYGVLLQTSFGSVLGWLGRGAQYAGSLAMLSAALASVREAHVSALPLDVLLEESEARYRALFEHMTEGFFVGEAVLDADGRPVDYRYLDVNPAFELMTGLARQDVVGRTARAVAREAPGERIALLGRVALTGERRRIEDLAGSGSRYLVGEAYSPAPGRFACIFSDETERKRAQDTLRTSEERFRRVFEHAAMGIAILDWGGRFLSVNPAFAHILGYSEDELRQMSFVSLLHPDDAAENLEQVRLLKAGELPCVQNESRYVRKDGTAVWVRKHVSLLPDATPTPPVLALVTDVSERKLAEEALQRSCRALQEADRRKDEYLAMLSHELRNPLAPLRNGIYVLEHAAPDSPQAARAREILRRQSEHLTRLVDDLLDVTRIARGKITLHRGRLDLREVVRRTTDDLGHQFEEARLRLGVDLPAAPVWADADATRVAQVLGNLLHNALKFTPAGGDVRVALRAVQGWAQLTVRDTGAGIAPAAIERMFEPFAQGEQGVARTQGGLGLGLALVRGLVELHGGVVRAHSEGPGRGAEFLVSLPLAAAPDRRAPEPGPGDAAAPRDGAAAREVLVIEDNRDAAQTLADVLRLRGHRVLVAHDASSGLAAARERRPQIILCDIGLPDASGYDVARAVRGDTALAPMRLVALTGYAQPEDRERAQAAGFDAHLPKPPSIEALEALLREPARLVAPAVEPAALT